jgi:hypothetical protein
MEFLPLQEVEIDCFIEFLRFRNLKCAVLLLTSHQKKVRTDLSFTTETPFFPDLTIMTSQRRANEGVQCPNLAANSSFPFI